MVWKRCRRHDESHDLDTRAHDWRAIASESMARWSKISSMTSCGILRMMIVSVFKEAGRFVSEGRFAFEDFEPILSGKS